MKKNILSLVLIGLMLAIGILMVSCNSNSDENFPEICARIANPGYEDIQCRVYNCQVCKNWTNQGVDRIHLGIDCRVYYCIICK